MKENQRQKNPILQEIKVEQKAELLPYLLEKEIRKSRNAIKSLLIHKQIRVNGKIISQHNFELTPNDVIAIYKHDNKLNEKKLKGLTIVYEDKDLLIIDKDSGLLSVSTGRELLKETAYNIVNKYIKEKNAKLQAYILYRLDRETSGLMVFAKNTDMQEELQQEWSIRPPKKTYLALVEGKANPVQGTITSWLTENKNYVMFASDTDNGGLKAVTKYKTLLSNNKYSLLEIIPETARKNQIRVQLQSIGHPIIGDKKYGSTISPLRRIALHANEISFFHPISKTRLEIKSPLPKKMQVIVDSLQTKKEVE